MPKSSIEIHFDGDISQNHEIPLNVLAKALGSIESSIHRSYLDLKYEGAVKHRRMNPDDIEDVLFWVGKSEDGGYKLNMACNTAFGKKVVDNIAKKLNRAMKDVEGKGKAQMTSIREQVQARQETLSVDKPVSYAAFKETAENAEGRSYSEKSILKEYAQLVQLIKSESAGVSTLELTLAGSKTVTIEFDKKKATKFSEILSEKEAGSPVLYSGEITALNKKTKNGKFINSETGKTSVLKMLTLDDFLTVHPLMAERKVEFVGSPVYEYGSIDTIAGDIYFLGLPK